MKTKEIRTLPDDEIGAEVEKARSKIFKMRFQGKSDAVENSGSLKTLRRHIARLNTVLHERETGRRKSHEAVPAKDGK
jgi:large subunit ribosomal protein L29